MQWENDSRHMKGKLNMARIKSFDFSLSVIAAFSCFVILTI